MEVDMTNIEQFPTGSFHWLQSNKIWENVLAFFHQPTDILNIYYTCQAFRDLIGGKIITVVLQLISDKKYISLAHGDKTVYNLRLVSKAWKEAADLAFMDRFITPKWLPNGLNDIKPFDLVNEKKHPNVAFFGSPTQVDRVLSLLEKSTSPFALVSIICVNENACPENDREIFKTKIMEFLDKHGDLVRGLYYISSGQLGDRIIHKYQRLSDVVKRLPFLKALKLRVYCYSRVFEAGKQLEKFIETSPFPTTPSLELIEFDLEMRFDDQASFTSELIRKSPNLKRIILFNNFSEQVNQGITSVLMENKTLEYLEMDYCLQTSLSAISAPMKSIKIRKFCDVNLPTLFSQLNQFSSTLECLELFLLRAAIPEDVKLNLPHLKRFCINGVRIRNVENFIIPKRVTEASNFSNGISRENTSIMQRRWFRRFR